MISTALYFPPTIETASSLQFDLELKNKYSLKLVYNVFHFLNI